MRRDPSGFIEAETTDSRDEYSKETCEDARHEAMAQTLPPVWPAGPLTQEKLRLRLQFRWQASLENHVPKNG